MSYVEHSPRRLKDEVGTVAWAFRVLDLPASATEAECRRSYRQDVLRSHPDRLVGEPEAVVQQAEARMRDVNHAWKVLQDHFRAEARRKIREDLWSPFDRPASPGSQRIRFENGYAERPPLQFESVGLGAGSLIAASLAGMIAMGFLGLTDFVERRDASRGGAGGYAGRWGARTISEFDSALSTETARHGIFGP